MEALGAGGDDLAVGDRRTDHPALTLRAESSDRRRKGRAEIARALPWSQGAWLCDRERFKCVFY
jgi:hypothetical protein